MWYEQVAQVLIIGIANGFLIALVALGYTLVYGIIELINFAHGDVFMIGSMLSLTLLTWAPSMFGAARVSLLPDATIVLIVVATLLIVMVCCALLNATIER